MGITEIIICLVGGFCAGILNTLAGFGSIITLAIYMDVLGIPGHLANATNRVNVLASSSISTFTFHSKGKLDLSNGKVIIAIVFLGAMVGAYLATTLDASGFKQAFKFLLIPIFIVLILNPKRFIHPDMEGAPFPFYISLPIYFILGIYAGFLQAGFGVIFLMAAVVISKFDIVVGSALKVAVVFLYTAVIVLYFHWAGMIAWKAGLTLAAGQALGGYVAARNMAVLEGANKWAYKMLIIIVGAVIIKNFEMWTWFGY